MKKLLVVLLLLLPVCLWGQIIRPGSGTGGTAIATSASAGRPAHWGAVDSLAWWIPEFGLQIDSTLQTNGAEFYIAGPLPKAVTIDSIWQIGGPTPINVTMAFYYNDTLWAEASGTSMISSPAAVTDEAIGAWQSVADNPNVPANNFIFGKYTGITTASSKHVIRMRYKYQ